MAEAGADPRFAALAAVMRDYFDGLYHSDAALLRTVFHPNARYMCATEGTLIDLGMAEYLPIVERRPSPASRGEARRDRILSIAFAGPVTALVRAECAIGPKRFLDILTFAFLEGRWQILAKVFHFDLAEDDPGA